MLSVFQVIEGFSVEQNSTPFELFTTVTHTYNFSQEVIDYGIA